MNKKNLDLVTALRHELHQHPELSGQEIWTKQRLMDFLRTHTNLAIVDKGLWFYAIYRAGDGRPNIAFRADIDAISLEEPRGLVPYSSRVPGVSHKCGHDGHAAILAGLALEIGQHGADKNVFFLFQHAEETGEGAAVCVSLIAEQQIDEIFACHNMSDWELGTVHVTDGTSNCASRGMTIHMEGAPAHASEPEKGINPAFAIARIINAIPDLIAPVNYRGMVLCTVIQVAVGERAFGVSASKGELLLTIRALYETELDALQQRLEDLARAEAGCSGLKVNFSYQESFPETVNHKESSDKIRQVCRAKGLPLVEMTEAWRASEDFGHYLKQTKGAICYIGNGDNHPHLHSYDYDFPDDIIETAVDLFKGLAEL